MRHSSVVLDSAEPDKTMASYEHEFGFAPSRTLVHPRVGAMMWFMRTDAWHHRMARACGPYASLHHASFELRGIDEDTWHPSRHDLTVPGVSDQWGTANAMNESVAATSFDHPDKGLLVARPV